MTCQKSYIHKNCVFNTIDLSHIKKYLSLYENKTYYIDVNFYFFIKVYEFIIN